MSKIEFRGQKLLDKWISGEITYLEELELFELAEEDVMLKDALEGYIEQGIVISEETNIVSPIYALERNFKKARIDKRQIVVWWRYAAAAILVVLVALAAIFKTNVGNLGYEYATDLDIQRKYDSINSSKNLNKLPTTPIDVNFVKSIKSKVQRKSSKESSIINDIAIQVLNESEIGFQNNPEIMPEIFLVVDQRQDKLKDLTLLKDDKSNYLNDFAQENELIEDLNGNIIPKGMNEDEVAYFKSNMDDEQLKRDVRKSALKDGNWDKPITAYEIDVKSGINPKDINSPNSDSIYLNLIGERSSFTGIASGTEKNTPSSKSTVNNVIFKEYKIDKLDILNPPMEDYNTLVRTKYKSKGKPEIGYFKYKKILKESVKCLVNTYKNVDYLEEVSIKFRVYRDGNIEFLELFGIHNEACIMTVSTVITKGPKWELKDYYESIDVEIPFKALYPFLF